MAGIDRFMAVFSSNVFCSNGDACQKMQKVSWGRRWERGGRREAGERRRPSAAKRAKGRRDSL